MDGTIGVHMWSYVYHTLLMLERMFKSECQFLNQGAWLKRKNIFKKYNGVHITSVLAERKKAELIASHCRIAKKMEATILGSNRFDGVECRKKSARNSSASTLSSKFIY